MNRIAVCWRFLANFIFLVLLLTGLVVTAVAEQCSFCQVNNNEKAEFCKRCLRALRWQVLPKPQFPYVVVVRTGKDAFIRGPNDGHPRHRFYHNAGWDRSGPLGSYYSATGLRYLIQFDIEEAFARADVSIDKFVPQEVILVLRPVESIFAREPIPIAVFPLKKPFEEGSSYWGAHLKNEPGCSWFFSATMLPWETPGGDFFQSPKCCGIIPASGSEEIRIDVTDIYLFRWQEMRRYGKWYDPGMILMRDVDQPTRGLYRCIYSFESAPLHKNLLPSYKVLSPELYFR